MLPALYQHLTTNILGVPRWFQYGDSRIPTAEKPFGVIEVGATRRMINNRSASLQEIHLTVYCPRGSQVQLLKATEEVKRKTYNVKLARVTGEFFRCQWAHTTNTWVDETLNANAQRLTFVMPQFEID